MMTENGHDHHPDHDRERIAIGLGQLKSDDTENGYDPPGHLRSRPITVNSSPMRTDNGCDLLGHTPATTENGCYPDGSEDRPHRASHSSLQEVPVLSYVRQITAIRIIE